ncbi:hypothetical protein BBK14_32150 [Parafrankia soli]|uniref:Uncharacterized protein n=1 Tax=Parafrankia soli TaxID=2599596 RepID=A0A1S1R3D5_9ACTN|nr:hypothetical protein BBK14_32150 [Parafrankia soli]
MEGQLHPLAHCGLPCRGCRSRPCSGCWGRTPDIGIADLLTLAAMLHLDGPPSDDRRIRLLLDLLETG